MTCTPPAWCLALVLALLTGSGGCGGKPKPADDPKAGDAPAMSPEEARAEAKKRLERIGAAVHGYVDANTNKLPGGTVVRGQPGLSWRVQLLPHLDETKLYQEFRQDEPWDSEHNKALIARMPEVYAPPGKAAPAGHTYLRSFAGETAIIGVPFARPSGPLPKVPKGEASTAPRARDIREVTDGTSHTLFAAEAAEPVVWTKPDELPFRRSPSGPPPVPKLGGVFPGGFHGLMCDGEAHFFPDGLTDEELRALITPSGDEAVAPKVIERVRGKK